MKNLVLFNINIWIWEEELDFELVVIGFGGSLYLGDFSLIIKIYIIIVMINFCIIFWNVNIEVIFIVCIMMVFVVVIVWMLLSFISCLMK